jgi:hypothetical protein
MDRWMESHQMQEETIRNLRSRLAEAEKARDEARLLVEIDIDKAGWPTCVICSKPETVFSCGSYCDACVPSAVRKRAEAAEAQLPALRRAVEAARVYREAVTRGHGPTCDYWRKDATCTCVSYERAVALDAALAAVKP